MDRVNQSLSAKIEQSILNFLVKLIPRFVSPDALTIIALMAAIGIGVSYFYAVNFRELYLVAAFLYFIHWFGDSLDGKIARDRGRPRPRYGHYVDHILDSVSVALILGGLIAPAATYSIMAVSGFLLLMIHSFLKASVTGRLELSLGFLGATEARIIGSLFSVVLFFTGNPELIRYTFKGVLMVFTLLDIVGILVTGLIWSMLVVAIIKTAKMLDREDRAKWKSK